MASPFGGIDPEVMRQIHELMQTMGPSEEDKKAARSHALLTTGLGMMQNAYMNPVRAAGYGGLLGAGSYNDELKQLSAQRAQNMGVAMQMQNMARQQSMMQAAQNMMNDGPPQGSPAMAPQGQAPQGQPPSGMPMNGAPGLPQQSLNPAQLPQLGQFQGPNWRQEMPREARAMLGASADPKAIVENITKFSETKMGPDGTVTTMTGRPLYRQNAAGIQYFNPDGTPGKFIPYGQDSVNAESARNATMKGAETTATEAAQFPYRTITAQSPSGAPVTGFQSDVLGQPASQRQVTLDPSLSPQQRQAAMADAQRSGYGGITGPDPIEQQRKAGAVQTQVAQNTTIGEGQAKDYLNIIDSEKQAPGNIGKYQLMKDYLGKIETGRFTPAVLTLKQYAASVAPNAAKDFTKDLPYAQAVSALSNEIALQLRNPTGGAGMPGSMSNSDRDFLVSMTANTANDPRAIPLMLDMRIAMEKRAQEVGKLARTYRAQNGTLDEGFYQQLQDYSNAHPMFDKLNQPPSTSGWSIKKLN